VPITNLLAWILQFSNTFLTFDLQYFTSLLI